MLSLLVLIRCVYVFRKISNEIETNTLSFCTDYDMRKFECLLFEGDDTEDAGKIIENKKYLTDQVLDLKNVKNYSLFEDWNPLMYIVKYQKLNNTNITLVSLNEFKEPCMYVKISSYVEYESFHQFEFTKATSTPNQNTESQVTLSCKLLKGQTNNDLTIIIVSDSNLGSMKSLLSLEFLSINSDLKKFVFKPMRLVYNKIINFFRDKSIDQGKINLFYKKFSIFLTVEKKATMLRYIFLTSENLELTYLNSDNMSFDEEKFFLSKLIYIREITIEIISAIKDILSEVQYIGISEDVIALIEEITKFLSSFYDKYENLLKKNLGSIQEKKFIKQVGKEDKIRNCFEFLNLYFNYQSLKADLFLLLCDYYANSLHLEKSRGLFDLYSSIVCVKKIQIKLLKDCIEKPTVRNLTKYLTFNESENVKVKDLQSLWIKFKKYFKMLNDEIEKQQEPNEYLVIIKQRQKTLEEQSEKLKADIDLFLVESFYFADLFLKTSIITYLLDNNEDVLRHKNL